MRKYIIMGPQGSGKGTQAKMLAVDYDLVHISVGDIFRWHVQNRTKLGTKVQRYMREGRLVPDEMVELGEMIASGQRVVVMLEEGSVPVADAAPVYVDVYDSGYGHGI